MSSCPKCLRLRHSYRFALLRRQRLDSSLSAAMASSDLLTFDALSWQLTQTESALQRLRDEADEHQSDTGHDALSQPEVEPVVESVTTGGGVPPAKGGPEDVMTVIQSSASEPRLLPIGSEIGFCEEKHRLLDQLLFAIRELSQLQTAQLRSVIEGSTDFIELEDAVHAAQQKKEDAKYALMAHIAAHHCENA